MSMDFTTKEKQHPSTKGETMQTTTKPKLGTPKLEVLKSKVNGQIVIEVVVKNSLACQELHDIICHLGYALTTDIANRRSLYCTTPAEVDAARDPIVRFFNSDGSFAL